MVAKKGCFWVEFKKIAKKMDAVKSRVECDVLTGGIKRYCKFLKNIESLSKMYTYGCRIRQNGES